MLISQAALCKSAFTACMLVMLALCVKCWNNFGNYSRKKESCIFMLQHECIVRLYYDHVSLQEHLYSHSLQYIFCSESSSLSGVHVARAGGKAPGATLGALKSI